MKQLCVFSVVAAALFLSSCSKPEAGKDAGAPPDSATADQALAAGSAPSAAAAVAAPAPKSEEAFITSATSLKREPNEKDRVTDPKTGKEVGNWLTLLERGEPVTALQADGDWIQVKASDDTTIGWTKNTSVLLAAGVAMATVLEDTKMFARPDFSSLIAGKPITIATLLFVTNTKGAFSEVNYQGSQKAWVQSDKLTGDAQEIEACRLVNKARWLEDDKNKKKDAAKAKEFWDLARSTFKDTKLVQALTATASAAPVGTDPAAGTTP